MKLQEAADFFNSLLIQTKRKSEIKIYQTFSGILTDLIRRDLPDSQKYAIENKLEQLELSANPNNRKKHLKQKLATFTSYLKEEFSLTPEEYYQDTGVSYGILYGMLAGIVLGPTLDISNGLVIGMVVGMAIGMVIGQKKDKEAKAENLVMHTQIK